MTDVFVDELKKQAKITLLEKGLTEKLAFLVHEQWSKWIKYMDTIAIHGETTIEFSCETWHNWLVKSNYDYEHLCENNRKFDREIAKLLWEPFFVEVFAEAKKSLDVVVDLHNKDIESLQRLAGNLALKNKNLKEELDGLKQKIQEALKELVKIIPHETKILTCDEDLTESWIVVSGDPEEWRGFEDRLDGWLEIVEELLGGTKQ
jgi:hypothetical protein